VGIHLPGYTVSTQNTTAQTVTALKSSNIVTHEVGSDCFLCTVCDDRVISLQRRILVTVAVDTESLKKPRNKLVFRLYVTVVSEMFV
jgi:hypothetical protein